MFPWLRLLRVGIGLIGNSKVDLLATTRIRLRVWPNDLDFNLHVNNGRYLALADIGRVHWFVRTGVLGIARQHKAFRSSAMRPPSFVVTSQYFKPSKFTHA
jgi:acyl-CoA thioesterase FadM